jgi:anti-sigma factor RsiW
MLVDYDDGNLSAEQTLEVDTHLAQCPDCQQTASALKESLHIAQILWQDNLENTESPSRARNLKKILLPAAAAAALLLIATLTTLFKPQSPPAPQPPTIAEINLALQRSEIAARLVAATEIYSDTEDALKEYDYIATTYPETTAAKKANSYLNQ